jgi:hypothetical protein
LRLSFYVLVSSWFKLVAGVLIFSDCLAVWNISVSLFLFKYYNYFGFSYKRNNEKTFICLNASKCLFIQISSRSDSAYFVVFHSKESTISHLITLGTLNQRPKSICDLLAHHLYSISYLYLHILFNLSASLYIFEKLKFRKYFYITNYWRKYLNIN